MGFWIKDDKLLVDASGQPIDCTTCLCAQADSIFMIGAITGESTSAYSADIYLNGTKIGTYTPTTWVGPPATPVESWLHVSDFTPFPAGAAPQSTDQFFYDQETQFLLGETRVRSTTDFARSLWIMGQNKIRIVSTTGTGVTATVVDLMFAPVVFNSSYVNNDTAEQYKFDQTRFGTTGWWFRSTDYDITHPHDSTIVFNYPLVP